MWQIEKFQVQNYQTLKKVIMNQTALIVFIIAQTTVIGFTLYFFYKVLKTPPPDLDDNIKDYNAT